MKLSIPAGTTSKRIGIFIQDSSSTVGAGLSGLAFNTSGLKCYSWIDTDGNAAGTAQTLATATLGTWTTIGFVEKDATNMKGMYEFGIPNALIAAGVKWCILYFYGATNMAPLVLEIEVTAVSNQDGVHGGMSALPNTPCTTNASLLTSGAGTDQLQVASGIASADVKKWLATAVTAATAGIPDVGVKNINNVSAAAVTTIKAVLGLDVAGVITTVTNQLTAAQIATGIWQDTTAGDFTVALSVGKSIMNGIALGSGLKIAECILTDTLTTYTGNTPQTGDAYARLGAPAGASVSADIASIKTDTGTTIPGLIAALNNLSTAQAKAQAVAALATDTYPEPGQATPPATIDLATKMSYIYKALINIYDQTSTLFQLYNNAGAVVDQKSAVSDDGTTFSKAKLSTGP